MVIIQCTLYSTANLGDNAHGYYYQDDFAMRLLEHLQVTGHAKWNRYYGIQILKLVQRYWYISSNCWKCTYRIARYEGSRLYGGALVPMKQ